MFSTFRKWLITMLSPETTKGSETQTQQASPEAPTQEPEIPTPESVEFYKPTERKIYRYWKGEAAGNTEVDPMVINRRLGACWGDLQVDMQVANSESKDADAAHDKALKQLREIFEVVPFDEGGLTEIETMELLGNFFNWQDEIKKKFNP